MARAKGAKSKGKGPRGAGANSAAAAAIRAERAAKRAERKVDYSIGALFEERGDRGGRGIRKEKPYAHEPRVPVSDAVTAADKSVASILRPDLKIGAISPTTSVNPAAPLENLAMRSEGVAIQDSVNGRVFSCYEFCNRLQGTFRRVTAAAGDVWTWSPWLNHTRYSPLSVDFSALAGLGAMMEFEFPIAFTNLGGTIGYYRRSASSSDPAAYPSYGDVMGSNAYRPSRVVSDKGKWTITNLPLEGDLEYQYPTSAVGVGDDIRGVTGVFCTFPAVGNPFQWQIILSGSGVPYMDAAFKYPLRPQPVDLGEFSRKMSRSMQRVDCEKFEEVDLAQALGRKAGKLISSGLSYLGGWMAGGFGGSAAASAERTLALLTFTHNVASCRPSGREEKEPEWDDVVVARLATAVARDRNLETQLQCFVRSLQRVLKDSGGAVARGQR